MAGTGLGPLDYLVGVPWLGRRHGTRGIRLSVAKHDGVIELLQAIAKVLDPVTHVLHPANKLLSRHRIDLFEEHASMIPNYYIIKRPEDHFDPRVWVGIVAPRGG
jgi:hypothetical protein